MVQIFPGSLIFSLGKKKKVTSFWSPLFQMRNPLSSESFIPLQVARHHFSLTAFRMFCCLQFLEMLVWVWISWASPIWDLCSFLVFQIYVFLQVGEILLLFLFFKIYLSPFGCAGSLLLHAGSSCSKTVTLQLWCTGFSPQWLLLSRGMGFRAFGLSGCGARLRQLPRGLWNLPRPGIKPESPALTGRFLSAELPAKSTSRYFSNSFSVLCSFSPPSGILIAQMLDPLLMSHSYPFLSIVWIEQFLLINL